MSKSSGLGWWTCEGWQPCNCLRIPKARRFQESRMPGNPLVRFDEGRVGRTRKVSPSLLLYSTFLALPAADRPQKAMVCPTALDGGDSWQTGEGMRVVIDATPLLVRSAGVKNY